MSADHIQYVLISPVRDEEENLESTIHAVAGQTVPPTEWVIVDDGSKDGTGAIIRRYAEQYPWIRPVRRDDRGFRKSGGGVVEAFYDGYRQLGCQDWDYLVKLDGDLTFELDYFERAFERFRKEPNLGIGGGTVYHMVNGKKEIEECPRFHVRGATKIYRRACWDAIGGLWTAPGWDTIDEVKANMLGWTTQTFPELHLIHHRFTGTADGTWGGAVKGGRACYVSGYHPLFVLARCVRRLVRKPFLIGSVGTLWGYLSGYLLRLPRLEDKAFIAYLRKQQLGRLTGRETIWK